MEENRPLEAKAYPVPVCRCLLREKVKVGSRVLASSSVDWNWYIPASTLPFFAVATVVAGITQRRGQKERSISR
jgi:hypothetical protein